MLIKQVYRHLTDNIDQKVHRFKKVCWECRSINIKFQTDEIVKRYCCLECESRFIKNNQGVLVIRIEDTFKERFALEHL